MGSALSGRQEKTYPVGAAIYLLGFWVHVQYRDILGNISPVYSYDISELGCQPS